ncbi:macrophage mannose receptor 1-like [Clarias gariepinus]|uniref:macrophage mannose receptor 1-like n=1 Tax=Clarias gariepinus TaxID=13013 RepID=UPI00234CEE59|nr:macrophage mannose receptor 1-like [Clarias gariepinus]
MNQTDARAACRENYTDLVTVYSDEDNTELYNLMMKAGGGGGWIGLYHDASSQTPNYYLILESKTWYEAQRYCRGRYTDLVSIRDQQQNEEVKIKGLNSSTSFWIGLLRDDWQWTDGGNSTYRNWWTGEPSAPPYNCVVLIGGKWMSWSCSINYYPLCYSSIHVSAEALSWQEALGYCNEGNRTGILNIDSEAKQKEVESGLRRGRVADPLWVGLRQSRFFGFWIWADGAAVSPYANWDEGKWPEGPLSQHCGAVVPPDYRWRDMNCGSRYRALCHIKCFP